MKDRTLIILAVLFLTFSIGSGVNKSLEAGNRTMGRPMAPDLQQLYNSNVSPIVGFFREFCESGEMRVRQIVYDEYPVFIGSVDQVRMLVLSEVKTRSVQWRTRFEKGYSLVKSKIQDKKSMVVR